MVSSRDVFDHPATRVEDHQARSPQQQQGMQADHGRHLDQAGRCNVVHSGGGTVGDWEARLGKQACR